MHRRMYSYSDGWTTQPFHFSFRVASRCSSRSTMLLHVQRVVTVIITTTSTRLLYLYVTRFVCRFIFNISFYHYSWTCTEIVNSKRKLTRTNNNTATHYDCSTTSWSLIWRGQSRGTGSQSRGSSSQSRGTVASHVVLVASHVVLVASHVVLAASYVVLVASHVVPAATLRWPWNHISPIWRNISVQAWCD